MTIQLSLSNIAFPHADLDAALDLLQELGVSGLEVAPYNVFGRWDVAPDEVRSFRARIEDRGFSIPAMQGIVFNAGDLHFFARPAQRDALFKHLMLVARMAGLLGAKACVFGAPRLRDPGALEPAKAQDMAIDFLRRLGPAYADEGAALAFEANAAHYQCKYVTTTAQAIELVSAVATPGIGLQIDTGTVFLEGEAPEVITRAAPLASHAHISEPDLAPIGTSGVDHAGASAALKAAGYTGTLSIEMRSTPDWPTAVRQAVALAQDLYLA